MQKSIVLPYINVGPEFTIVGSSYFATYGQTVPYLYQKITTFFKKNIIGYTVGLDNNGKTAHDRLRKVHIVHEGIDHPNTLFLYMAVNDMFYQSSSSAPDRRERAIKKIVNAHQTAFANAFTKTFNYFIDESNVSGTSSFEDVNHLYASKSFTATKDILVLDTINSTVKFQSTGLTNIVYFISDGENLELGTFNVYVDGILHSSIDSNRQTIYYPDSYNPTVTLGLRDYYGTPNSLILNLVGTHTISIVSTSNVPVWLDYHSELETNLANGAKPVISFDVPKMRTDKLVGAISGLWWVDNDYSETINIAMKKLYEFWRKEYNAPVALGNSFYGFDPINGMNSYEASHFSQSGSDFVIKEMSKAIINANKGKFIAL